MDKQKTATQAITAESPANVTKSTKKQWKKPAIEDVSGRVMAQPYIRFT